MRRPYLVMPLYGLCALEMLFLESPVIGSHKSGTLLSFRTRTSVIILIKIIAVLVPFSLSETFTGAYQASPRFLAQAQDEFSLNISALMIHNDIFTE